MKLLALLFLPLIAMADTFVAPQSVCDPATTGAHFPRTLNLLRTSTAEHRNKVRILFYGQSITEQEWSRETMENLRKLFPHAELEMENRAIGGHSSQILVKTAEADLYPFYPDLVIFHVYGDHNRYEDIIRRIRERTTAEVIMQTDHYGANDPLVEEMDPAKLAPNQWNQWMNYSQLPTIAKKYGAELLDQRNLWRKYLQDHKLEPKALLKDGVHLNENGCHLMAAIVTSAFSGQAKAADESWKSLVTSQPVTPGAVVKLSFTGNRLDADVPVGNAHVLIDGQSPAQLRGCWTFTKVSGYNGTNWPCLLQVQRGATVLQDEDWEITLQSANDDYTDFQFTLMGSKTGPDGTGNAKEKFTSKSSRIIIAPDDWNLQFSKKVFTNPLQAPFTTIKFRSQLRAAESTVLAQGLTNGPHTAEISGLPAMRAVRIFRPAFPETEQ